MTHRIAPWATSVNDVTTHVVVGHRLQDLRCACNDKLTILRTVSRSQQGCWSQPLTRASRSPIRCLATTTAHRLASGTSPRDSELQADRQPGSSASKVSVRRRCSSKAASNDVVRIAVVADGLQHDTDEIDMQCQEDFTSGGGSVVAPVPAVAGSGGLGTLHGRPMMGIVNSTVSLPHTVALQLMSIQEFDHHFRTATTF